MRRRGFALFPGLASLPRFNIAHGHGVLSCRSGTGSRLSATKGTFGTSRLLISYGNKCLPGYWPALIMSLTDLITLFPRNSPPTSRWGSSSKSWATPAHPLFQSISLSARARIDGGTCNPRAAAVARFTTKSKC